MSISVVVFTDMDARVITFLIRSIGVCFSSFQTLLQSCFFLHKEEIICNQILYNQRDITHNCFSKVIAESQQISPKNLSLRNMIELVLPVPASYVLPIIQFSEVWILELALKEWGKLYCLPHKATRKVYCHIGGIGYEKSHMLTCCCSIQCN